MNHFTRVHTLVGQRRHDREAERFPIAHQRPRITELETALKDLFRAGDSFGCGKSKRMFGMRAALAADKVLGATHEHSPYWRQARRVARRALGGRCIRPKK